MNNDTNIILFLFQIIKMENSNFTSKKLEYDDLKINVFMT